MREPLVVPLFPLQTVLFPGGALPLRIFEPRYVDMVGRCFRDTGRFGVLSIVEGSETGAARTVTVGTLAEIVDFRRDGDGLLGITVVGAERFATRRVTQQRDRLYVGEIEVLAAEPAQRLPDEFGDLATVLQRVLETVGSAPARVAYDDATWVGYRLAEVLPLSLEDRQMCLEMEDPIARLERLRSTFN